MTDATSLVKNERRGATALVTLNRPEALNALNSATLDLLLEVAEEISRDAEVRAVVVTGEGRAFAAGADISEMVSRAPAEAAAFSKRGHDAFAAFEALDVPTIAAVNGFALGGGCELACACDWIYASSKAQFGQPEVGLGIIPGFGGTSRLTRRVGVAWAKELCLTGGRLKADEALRIGLANRVFDPDELMEAALGAGETIAANGPLAVAVGKRVIQQGQDADLALANAYEQSAFGMTFGTEDRREGMQAFLDKREAKFSGK
jgi:enoyl-CoA hydratase